MTAAPIPHLSPDLLESSHEMHARRNGIRFCQFVLIYVASAALTIFAASQMNAWWQWGLLAPFYLLSAASLHGISLFTHEAVHGTRPSSARASTSNKTGGSIPLRSNSRNNCRRPLDQPASCRKFTPPSAKRSFANMRFPAGAWD